MQRSDFTPRGFGIEVRIVPELLLGEGSGVVPGRAAAETASGALAWVLYALFAYGDELGLKRPAFW